MLFAMERHTGTTQDIPGNEAELQEKDKMMF